MERIQPWRIGVVGLLVGFAIVLFVVSVYQTPVRYFKIHFLDVGQGDAILIQTPDGYEALVDGGATRLVLRQIAKHQTWFDRQIELVVATHVDTDHVGGLVDVFDHYQVDVLLETEADSDSPAAVAFADSVSQESVAIMQARAGQIIQLGASTTIEILTPKTATKNWQTNAASIVLQVAYGDTKILLTGDAPMSVEDYLVNVFGSDLESDILKLGHHGSKTSTSGLFLDTVKPQFAIVSAGIDNRYGHPHQEVMQRVFDRNITTFHTGIDGTVTFYSDGQRVWRKNY